MLLKTPGESRLLAIEFLDDILVSNQSHQSAVLVMNGRHRGHVNTNSRGGH
jgi:hypothetical protein